MHVCIYHHDVPGKQTDWTESREKEYFHKAKLTEKQLQMLEKGKVDGSLGMATPSSLLEAESTAPVKNEVPSLESLKEAQKSNKMPQLFNCFGSIACL
jgi:hypothetical protein